MGGMCRKIEGRLSILLLNLRNILMFFIMEEEIF